MHVTYNRSVLALAIAMCLAGGPPTLAQTARYDAVADFSLNSNPNGVWTYLLYPRPLGTSFNMTTTAVYGVTNWNAWINGSSGPAAAVVARNLTGAAILSGTIDAPVKQLFLDPGTNEALSVVFTAPVKGVYHLRGEFYGVDQHEQSHQVRIQAKNLIVFTNYIYRFNQSSLFHHTITLKAGETVMCSIVGLATSHPTHIGTGLKLAVEGPLTKG